MMNYIMYWTILYCLIIVNANEIVKKGSVQILEEYQFTALKCDNVKTTAMYSGKKFCDPDKIRAEYGLMDQHVGGTYSVIQFNPVRKFKGMKCEKRISTITAVCGAFSHSKLVEPPDVLKPARVPQRECMDVIQTQLVNTEDGRQVRVPAGSTVTYKYIESGSVTMSETNVACEGGEVKLNGKKHENIIELITVQFTLDEIDVSEKGGRLKTSDGILPRQCQLATEGCSLDEQTVVLDLSKLNLCSYAHVRVAEFSTFTHQGKHMLINDEHKILLEVKDKMSMPNECLSPGKLIKTNFDRLFLYGGDITPGIDLVDPANIDLELETRLTDFYLSYWALALSKEAEAKWQSELCSLSANRLSEDQPILHGNHVLKMQGELISEFPCDRVTVRTREGHRMEGDDCLDHLPAYLGEEVVYVAPLTRVLVPRNGVSVINCSAHYPVIFEDVLGRQVTANPDVQVIELELSEYHFMDDVSANHSEMFQFSSLLYTKEEVEGYEAMLLGNKGEKAVSRQFSSYYCATTGECTPSRGTKGFKWERMIQDPSELVNMWWDQVKESMIFYGALWGCFDFVITMIQLLTKLLVVAKNWGKSDLTGRALMRFVFLPGQELVNLFPREPRIVRYRRQPSPGNPLAEAPCSVPGCGSDIELGLINPAE